MSNTRLSTGKNAEKKAEQYLLKQGLSLLQRNYSWPYGEIDLIMLDKKTIVFVEVRARRSQVFGGAAASITFKKQQKIIKTAYHYLQNKKLFDKQPVRFDIIAFEGAEAEIHWIQNAFYAQD